MQALQLNRVTRVHRYASHGFVVTPLPPQAGVETTIALYLRNGEPAPLTVKRIDMQIARFGMGLAWESLPSRGPFELLPNGEIEATWLWTPEAEGHRCLRAALYLEEAVTPIHARCNLQVVEASAAQQRWVVPFHLGNPTEQRQPLVLARSEHLPADVATHILVRNRPVLADEPIWLEPHEEVPALLMVRARTSEAFESVSNIEAYINGRFIDGLRVLVRRPARVLRQGLEPLDGTLSETASLAIR